MPRNEHSDQRYEATRDDVLAALAPRDNDTWRWNEEPHTDFEIVLVIMDRRGLPGWPPGRALKRNRLRELLERMAADGEIVGRTRAEWSAAGRTLPSRARDVLYARKDVVAAWEQENNQRPQGTEGSNVIPLRKRTET